MAVMLAVAIGAGPAFAEAPVVPATTVAAQPDDQSKVDPKDGEDKPKVEEPKVEKPDVEAPKVAKSDVEEPKLETSGKPRDDKAKPEKPKSAPPKPQPETPKQAQPKPAKPKPTPQPKPAQPKSAQAGAPSVQPNEPGPEPQVDAAKSVSPRPKAAPRVAASRIRHGTTRGRPAPKESRKAARRPAGAVSPERSGTEPAGSGRDSADATSATSHPVAATPTLAPRLASHGAAASASLDRHRPRVLILDAHRPSFHATPLLAIVLNGRGLPVRTRGSAPAGRRVPALTPIPRSIR